MDCCHRLFAAHIYVKVVLSLSEMFEGDTMRGGAQRPDLINMLRHETAPGVHGIVDKFGVDLSLVSRFGWSFSASWQRTISTTRRSSPS